MPPPNVPTWLYPLAVIFQRGSRGAPEHHVVLGVYYSQDFGGMAVDVGRLGPGHNMDTVDFITMSLPGLLEEWTFSGWYNPLPGTELPRSESLTPFQAGPITQISSNMFDIHVQTWAADHLNVGQHVVYQEQRYTFVQRIDETTIRLLPNHGPIEIGDMHLRMAEILGDAPEDSTFLRHEDEGRDDEGLLPSDYISDLDDQGVPDITSEMTGGLNAVMRAASGMASSLQGMGAAFQTMGDALGAAMVPNVTTEGPAGAVTIHEGDIWMLHDPRPGPWVVRHILGTEGTAPFSIRLWHATSGADFVTDPQWLAQNGLRTGTQEERTERTPLTSTPLFAPSAHHLVVNGIQHRFYVGDIWDIHQEGRYRLLRIDRSENLLTIECLSQRHLPLRQVSPMWLVTNATRIFNNEPVNGRGSTNPCGGELPLPPPEPRRKTAFERILENDDE